MKTIALIIMVAIVLEALVEYAKTVMYMFEECEYKTAITQLVTIVVGVGLAFGFHTQLFNAGLSEIYEGLHINPILDMVLTGILFSRGSNYFSDLISKLTGKQHGVVDDFDEDEDEDFDENQQMLEMDALVGYEEDE